MSKVTYKILYSKWHNGINMDRSDILYPQYFLFEWGSNKGMADHTSDPEYTSQAQVALPLVKGIRFIANDMVESYVDIWHYDKKEIADSASIWPSEPWEITALQKDSLPLENSLIQKERQLQRMWTGYHYLYRNTPK